MMRKHFTGIKFLLLSLITNFQFSNAQVPGYAWWESRHGISSEMAKHLLRRVPAFMGPHALPVPEMFDTKVGYRTFVATGMEYYRGKGEQTINPDITLHFPIQKNRLSLSLRSKLLEWYRMNPTLRDERYARDSAGMGFSVGETFLQAKCRVLQDFHFFPDISVDAGLKFYSGGNFENARHTGAAAYWIDGIAAKTIVKNKTQSIRISMSGGAYFWQSGEWQHRRALLYGIGFLLTHKNMVLYTGINGYRGKLNNGDRPMLLRLRWELNTSGNMFFIGYQLGINDFVNNAYVAGLAFKIGWTDRINPY
ncbi:MAG: hypothetical protein ACK5CV_10900 [Bacteroidota bacterium]|jgi:hypothetical protein